MATGVPKEDWADWATLLSTSEDCDAGKVVSDGIGGGGVQARSAMHRNRLDKLACVDEVMSVPAFMATNILKKRMRMDCDFEGRHHRS